MAASTAKPIYTVYIVSGSNKYNVTPAVESIRFADQEKQMAQYVTLDLMNQKAGNSWLTSIIAVRDRVYIYANDGNKSEEVFRGYVWNRSYRSSLTERNFQLKCYDNLIYFQESDDSVYFSSGKSTKDVCSSLCKKWGVSLKYSYETITHSKLALRGTLSDIFTSDILDTVKKKTGKKYVMRSEKDVIIISGVGQNSTIYQFIAGKNAIETYSECTMDGMVTKVIILGKADDDDREPVEATVTGNTSKYGTLQKTVNRSENTSLSDAKKEAQSTIDENGKPKWEYELRASDIPWIRKGDKVYVSAGDTIGHLIVTGIDRTISNKQCDMILSLEKP